MLICKIVYHKKKMHISIQNFNTECNRSFASKFERFANLLNLNSAKCFVPRTAIARRTKRYYLPWFTLSYLNIWLSAYLIKTGTSNFSIKFN
jgi:hypothetical protein